MSSVSGAINYAKRKKGCKAITPSDSGLKQGGEFMENVAKGSKDALANLDTQQMRIYDARPVCESLDIDIHGCCLCHNFTTSLTETLDVLFEEREVQIREVYWPEICGLARQAIVSDGRNPKYVFALGTQKFTEDKSRGLLGAYSRSAHSDFSDVVFDNAYKMLTKRGVTEEEAHSMDIMLVNAWKPFGSVVHDNPLTILDWTSVDPSADVHGLPRGAKVVKGNILASTVTHNPSHRWLYVPEMTPNEVWLFKQADSRPYTSPARPGLAKHAFHTSFKQNGQPDRARRSIAVRLICAFEPLPKSSL
jgi:hypothetical protein